MLSGQCRPSVEFRARQVGWGGGLGESQSSDVSSAMSSDCVSDVSRSLRMLSGWASVTSPSPSLSEASEDSPRDERDKTLPRRELQSWGSSTEAAAVAHARGARSSSLVKHRWLGLVSMSTWISRFVPSLQHITNILEITQKTVCQWRISRHWNVENNSFMLFWHHLKV